MFASRPLDHDPRDMAQHKAILAERFAGMGWEVPRLLEAMRQSPSLYFDAVGRIDMDCTSRGRVVLLGDAGYGGTLGGQGTGLAVVCAYVLAGELAVAQGDHRRVPALRSADPSIAPALPAEAKHVGSFYAPPTRVQLALRNHDVPGAHLASALPLVREDGHERRQRPRAPRVPGVTSSRC